MFSPTKNFSLYTNLENDLPQQFLTSYTVYTQITSNNSWCVPLVDSWVEPTLSHVILQLTVVSIVGAKHQVGVAPKISGQ